MKVFIPALALALLASSPALAAPPKPAPDPRDARIAELTSQLRQLGKLLAMVRQQRDALGARFNDDEAKIAAAAAIAQEDAAAKPHSPPNGGPTP